MWSDRMLGGIRISQKPLPFKLVTSKPIKGVVGFIRSIGDDNSSKRRRVAARKMKRMIDSYAEESRKGEVDKLENEKLNEALDVLKSEYYDPQMEEFKEWDQEEEESGRKTIDMKMFDMARPLWNMRYMEGKEGEWYKNLPAEDILKDKKLPRVPKVKKPYHVLNMDTPLDDGVAEDDAEVRMELQMGRFLKDDLKDDPSSFRAKSSVSRVISRQDDPSVVHVHGFKDKTRSSAESDSGPIAGEANKTFDEILLDEIKGQIAMGIRAPYIRYKRKGEDGNFVSEEDEMLGEYEDEDIRTKSGVGEKNVEIGEIFQKVTETDDGIDNLEYWPLYPKKVRRWLVYTMVPKGNYNIFGKWEAGARYKILEDYEKDLKTFEIEKDEKKLEGRSAIFTDMDYVQGIIDDHMAHQHELEGEGTRESKNVTECVEDDEVARDREEALFQSEQRFIPVELRGQYRFGIKEDEISDLHPRLKRLFSFKNANDREVTKFQFQQYIERYGKHPSDTGNSAVQIAILTLRIKNIQKSIAKYGRNPYNEMRMVRMAKRRRGLMKHLKANDLFTYYTLLKDIKLKDQVELFKKKHVIPIKVDRLAKILNKKS